MRTSSQVGEGIASGPTGLQVEPWRLVWQELLAEAGEVAELRAWEGRRRQARVEMLELLDAYLAGSVDTESFRVSLQVRSRTDWRDFALHGPSGAMFLTQLVRLVPRDELEVHLRLVLRAPREPSAAGRLLRRFVSYLEGLERTGRLSSGNLQPARGAFFATVWWHLRDPERWPPFYPAVRAALRREQTLRGPTGDAVEDYVAFRDTFLGLRSALGLTSWELEHLCRWHLRRAERESELELEPASALPRRRTTPPRAGFLPPPGERVSGRPIDRSAPVAVVREPEAPGYRAAEQGGDEEGLDHAHVQWVLAKIGWKLGYRVWVAANDWSRSCQGESLGSLSVRRLPPLGVDAASQRIVSLIDVVWLRGANEVAAAFEIEHTTAVYSGLLRMADLAALSPNLRFPLYVVAPRDRLNKVRRELSRPTLRALNLHRRCGFFASETLLESAESIMRWATDISALDQLAAKVDDPEPRRPDRTPGPP
ncbi:MAG: hypothetical protein ACREON_01385 [Gemmatimonadaceae bacterium]